MPPGFGRQSIVCENEVHRRKGKASVKTA